MAQRNGDSVRCFGKVRTIACTSGRQMVISPMTNADIDMVARLYRDVWIHRGNYKDRLDPGARDNFERAGGMFRIQDERGLSKLVHDESEFVWVAKSEDGEALGTFWCGLNDPKYMESERIQPFPGYPDLSGHVQHAFAERTLYFSREILVSPACRGTALAETLFYTAMCNFYSRGYTMTCGEVYRVNAIRDAHGEHKVDMYNNASHNMLLRTGARCEGAFAPIQIQADGFIATISMQIMVWELASALEKTREALRLAGVYTWEEQV